MTSYPLYTVTVLSVSATHCFATNVVVKVTRQKEKHALIESSTRFMRLGQPVNTEEFFAKEFTIPASDRHTEVENQVKELFKEA